MSAATEIKIQTQKQVAGEVAGKEDSISLIRGIHQTARTIVIVADGAITLTGIIFLVSGISKSSWYKEKLKALSVDVKSTHAMTGISLQYRF